MTINERIKFFAENYIGIREKPGNMGFENPLFEAKMKAIGHDPGESWCCLFAELVWREAYVHDPKMDKLLNILFSDSCTATLSNFRGSVFPVTHEPVIGAIMIMQKYEKVDNVYRATWQGHAGVVVEVRGNEILNVEGNSNQSGAREGIEVATKRRLVNFDLHTGLVIKAFIHPL